MDLSFNADMLFVLNNTDANLYVNQGGTHLPNATYYDLIFPPKSYTIYDPRGAWQWAAFLDSPTEKDVWVIFCYGFADEYRALNEALGVWNWYLPDFSLYPANMLEFFFDFTPAPPLTWCYHFDFTAGAGGWSPITGTSSLYVPGTGFVSVFSGGSTYLNTIFRNFSNTVITSIQMFFNVELTVSESHSITRLVRIDLGGVLQDQAVDTGTIPNDNGYDVALGGVSILANRLITGASFTGLAGEGRTVLTDVYVTGDGVNPFGSDNC